MGSFAMAMLLRIFSLMESFDTLLNFLFRNATCFGIILLVTFFVLAKILLHLLVLIWIL